jgi:hypothetical protein
MDHKSYAELRAHYSDLRQIYPIYLEQLQNLYRITNLDRAGVLASVRDIEQKLQLENEKVKTSAIGTVIRKWVPSCIGSVLSIGAAMLPNASIPLTIGSVLFQAIGLLDSKQPLQGAFAGARSMMMNANADIVKAARLPRYLGKQILSDSAPS